MEKLKELRTAARLTQDELARLAGTSRENVCRYETGARRPNVYIAAKLAAALHCTIDDLVKEGE